MSQTKAQLFDVSNEGPTALKNGAFDVTLGAGGNVTISDGNLVLASGSGIDFSATGNGSGTVESELLNDYEEGTFTPTVIGTTAAGTGTYTYQVGAYTKVGRLVTFTIAISWTAHTGTGSLRINGLPFAAGSVSSDGSTVAIRATALTVSANHYLTGAQVPDSSTQIIVHEYPVVGGAISGVAMDAFASIWVTGSYYV